MNNGSWRPDRKPASGCLAQSSDDKNYIAKHIRKQRRAGCGFVQDVRAEPSADFTRFQIQVFGPISLPRYMAKQSVAWKSQNWAGHRCRRLLSNPCFLTLHLTLGKSFDLYFWWHDRPSPAHPAGLLVWSEMMPVQAWSPSQWGSSKTEYSFLCRRLRSEEVMEGMKLIVIKRLRVWSFPLCRWRPKIANHSAKVLQWVRLKGESPGWPPSAAQTQNIVRVKI